MGIERKWAPTMMKIDEDEPGTGTQHFFMEILRTKHGGTDMGSPYRVWRDNFHT